MRHKHTSQILWSDEFAIMATEHAVYQKGEDYKHVWDKAETKHTDTHLEIMGKPVMESWETPYMHKLAEIATSKGGRVLEVGFGMAISATEVQRFDIREHVIIECNEKVYKNLEAFAEGAVPKVTPMKGSLEYTRLIDVNNIYYITIHV